MLISSTLENTVFHTWVVLDDSLTLCYEQFIASFIYNTVTMKKQYLGNFRAWNASNTLLKVARS